MGNRSTYFGASTNTASGSLSDRRSLDDYRTYLMLSGAPPNPDVLKFSDERQYIRGVTVFNQSTVTIGLYLNRNQNGSPDIIIPGGQALGLPIPNAKYIGVGFLTVAAAPPTGQAYVHFTTDLVVSTAASISTVGGGMIWDQSNWDAANWNA
jgi:hypothetical protein